MKYEYIKLPTCNRIGQHVEYHTCFKMFKTKILFTDTDAVNTVLTLVKRNNVSV